MALTAGNKILYSDFNNVKTAVENAYRKTKGTAASWTNAPTAAGQLAKYASLSQLNSNGDAANRALVTARNSTYYASHGTGGTSREYVQYNTNKSTYYTGNNKCGGGVTYGLDFYSFYGSGNSYKS